MPTQSQTNPFEYSDSNKRYHTYDYYMKHRFGQKCAKLPIDAGFSCPNRDGRVGVGGCIYCSARGSGDTCAVGASIERQIRESMAVMSRKWENPLGVAYFQAFTNTYAPVEVLRERFESALACENIVGLSIATRADCLPPEVCELLAELAERTFLTVELGLQTAHDSTARLINRGHTLADFEAGFARLRASSDKISIGVHLIDGLPFEDDAMMLESVRYVASLRPEQVKIHLLHVLSGTRLADLYSDGAFECLTRDEYVEIVVRQLEILPPSVVIGRLTGDGVASDLIAPMWSLRKVDVLNSIDKEMYRRATYQGRLAD